MLETLIEVLFGGLIEALFLFLLKYPAAFIVWCFFRFKKPFAGIIEDDSYLWGVLVLFLIAVGFVFYIITNTTPISSTN